MNENFTNIIDSTGSRKAIKAAMEENSKRLRHPASVTIHTAPRTARTREHVKFAIL